MAGLTFIHIRPSLVLKTKLCACAFDSARPCLRGLSKLTNASFVVPSIGLQPCPKAGAVLANEKLPLQRQQPRPAAAMQIKMHNLGRQSGRSDTYRVLALRLKGRAPLPCPVPSHLRPRRALLTIGLHHGRAKSRSWKRVIKQKILLYLVER